MNNIYNNRYKASDPEISAWVNASAGTGKTKILIDRLLRLLLNGVAVDNILCITFTNIAAQEMTNRLMQILAQWSISDALTLEKEIYLLSNETPSEEMINQAQGLFSKILDHPEGIQIQTIHSFCQNILSRFPVEANIATTFMVIEEGFSQELQNQAIQEALKNLAYKAQSKAEDKILLNTLVTYISSFSFEKNVARILQHAEQIEVIIKKYDLNRDLQAFKEQLYRYLEADPLLKSNHLQSDFLQISYADYIDNFKVYRFQGGLFPRQEFLEIIKIFANYNITHKIFGKAMYDFLNAPLSYQINNFSKWIEFFFTKSTDSITKNKKARDKKGFLTQENLRKLSVTEADFIMQTVEHELTRINEFNDIYKNQISAEINLAFMQLAVEIYNKYQQLKEDAGLLDFNDLIYKTYTLLNNTYLNPWVMYKLDQKIDHILVDEAQDTSPMQWEIIKYFIDEFFLGTSSKEKPRTIFVVGDIKQSIYSFQGADPYIFKHMRQFIQDKIEAVNQKLYQINMKMSFRSSQAIIAAVNYYSHNLFDNKAPPYEKEELDHDWFNDRPSCVEIWPILAQSKESYPFARYKNLAQSIVNKIKELNAKKNIVYGDILILYRKRKNNHTLDYLIKFLKDDNIPVLGVDKLNLNKNIAVQDLIALAKFLQQPKDDFSLACVLKSPIFNLNDQHIFNLTIKINQSKESLSVDYSLFTALKSVNSLDLFKDLFDDDLLDQPLVNKDYKLYNDIYEQLQYWINLSKEVGVFELFFNILYIKKNINRFIKRLGQEVVDPISEFMNLIFNFKQKYPDDLQSFLKFITANPQDIARDSFNKKTSINLLTIHASKGLEAKVVFLINDIDNKLENPTILFNKDSNHPLLLINVAAEFKANKIYELLSKKNQEDTAEAKRLLYVAITRAKDYLYICSIRKNQVDNDKEETDWQDLQLISKAPSADPIEAHHNLFSYQPFSSFTDPLFSKERGFIADQGFKIDFSQKQKTPKINKEQKVAFLPPNWVLKQPPKEPYPTRPLSPSKIDFEDIHYDSPLMSNKDINLQINKGIIVHKILEQIEILNDLGEGKEEFINNFLEGQKYNLTPKSKQEILTSVNNIIKDAKFGFLFQYKGLNEVTLSGKILQENDISIVLGRVDKIIIIDNNIFIIDYKFSRKKAVLSSNHHKQVTLYKKLLQNIYPNHIIRGLIIFTQDGYWVEIT
ncbi:ATP-dependent helicase/nuclease subunit A [Candidatus Hepatincolaceae symbiont of Richtersius coronifer]